MLIHLQISEAFQSIFHTEDSLQKFIIDYENKKVKEIHEFIIASQQQPANLHTFKQRVQFLTRTYNKEGKGVWPFVYGRDYRPNMPDEEIDYLNSAVYLAMGEREK